MANYWYSRWSFLEMWKFEFPKLKVQKRSDWHFGDMVLKRDNGLKQKILDDKEVLLLVVEEWIWQILMFDSRCPRNKHNRKPKTFRNSKIQMAKISNLCLTPWDILRNVYHNVFLMFLRKIDLYRHFDRL